VYAAALYRLGVDLASIEELAGPLWPRALIVAAAMLACMGLMGLYSPRLRATYASILLRIILSAAVAVTTVGLTFYVLPALHLGRGVLGCLALLLVIFAAATRLVWALLTNPNRD
jgi:FlaA1/EpsC-like NDP-sugar epimerase